MFRLAFAPAMFHVVLLVLALAAPSAFATPQQVYAPFSGILYMVAPNGQTVDTASVSCPASAPNACSNYNSPNWCCPSGYVCAVPASSPNILGCCPSGASCSGTPTVTTVTVAAAPVIQQSTVYVQATPTVYALPTTVYTQPTTVVVAGAGPYCSTLTADGPGLPTTRQGSCGTILIVSSAEALRAVGALTVAAASLWVGAWVFALRFF